MGKVIETIELYHEASKTCALSVIYNMEHPITARFDRPYNVYVCMTYEYMWVIIQKLKQLGATE